MVVPRGLGAQVAHVVPAGPVGERVEQALADTVSLRVGAHADDLEPQRGFAAAEFAFEHAREDVAGKAGTIRRRELSVKLGRLQCRLQAPLEITAPRPAFDRRVDRDDRVEILAGEGAYRNVRAGGSHRHPCRMSSRCHEDI